jgi:cell division protein FtsW
MAIFLAMVLIAGVDLKYFLVFIPVIALGIVYFIKVEPYRLKRWFTYLDPWQDALGAGWQTIQSLIAIGSGGPLGVGIFESQQKYYYLPTPHTDFIFSIIGEELGLWGGLLVLAAFFIILQRGFYIALNAKTHFLKYLASGLTLMIIVQALVNIYVATGLLPPKGTTLPFLSFGGSSLIANVIAVAILLSISRNLSGAKA